MLLLMMQDLFIWILLMSTMAVASRGALHPLDHHGQPRDRQACDFTGFGFYSYLYQLNEGCSRRAAAHLLQGEERDRHARPGAALPARGDDPADEHAHRDDGEDLRQGLRGAGHQLQLPRRARRPRRRLADGQHPVARLAAAHAVEGGAAARRPAALGGPAGHVAQRVRRAGPLGGWLRTYSFDAIASAPAIRRRAEALRLVMADRPERREERIRYTHVSAREQLDNLLRIDRQNEQPDFHAEFRQIARPGRSARASRASRRRCAT